MSQLGHLSLLEAESIHILREVAAEFQRPVMLYSIGKDSSVLLRLAQKAFHPVQAGNAEVLRAAKDQGAAGRSTRRRI